MQPGQTEATTWTIDAPNNMNLALTIFNQAPTRLVTNAKTLSIKQDVDVLHTDPQAYSANEGRHQVVCCYSITPSTSRLETDTDYEEA